MNQDRSSKWVAVLVVTTVCGTSAQASFFGFKKDSPSVRIEKAGDSVGKLLERAGQKVEKLGAKVSQEAGYQYRAAMGEPTLRDHFRNVVGSGQGMLSRASTEAGYQYRVATGNQTLTDHGRTLFRQIKKEVNEAEEQSTNSKQNRSFLSGLFGSSLAAVAPLGSSNEGVRRIASAIQNGKQAPRARLGEKSSKDMPLAGADHPEINQSTVSRAFNWIADQFKAIYNGIGNGIKKIFGRAAQ